MTIARRRFEGENYLLPPGDWYLHPRDDWSFYWDWRNQTSYLDLLQARLAIIPSRHSFPPSHLERKDHLEQVYLAGKDLTIEEREFYCYVRHSVGQDELDNLNILRPWYLIARDCGHQEEFKEWLFAQEASKEGLISWNYIEVRTISPLGRRLSQLQALAYRLQHNYLQSAEVGSHTIPPILLPPGATEPAEEDHDWQRLADYNDFDRALRLCHRVERSDLAR